MSVMPLPTSRALPERPWGAAIVPLGESSRALARTLSGPRRRGSRRESEPHRDVDEWYLRLPALLAPLRSAFAEHRTVTEGEAGLYAEVVHDAPRLARAVDGLLAEHDRLEGAMQALAHMAEDQAIDQASLRERALRMLADLSRHRQHDADLVQEAYATDIGGE